MSQTPTNTPTFVFWSRKGRDVDNVIIDVVSTLFYKRRFNVDQLTLYQGGFTNIESTSINECCFHVESTLTSTLFQRRESNVDQISILNLFSTSNQRLGTPEGNV